MSETQEFIGKTHNKDLDKDAIHIAVVQVTANEKMKPGEHIGFINGPSSYVTTTPKQLIGIADPFIEGDIPKNVPFFMFLYPNSITSLNHSWTHPAFATQVDKEKAEEWLQTFLKDDYEDYDQYEYVLERFKNGDDYWTFSGTDVPDKLMESSKLRKKFWDMLEVVTGVKATEAQRKLDRFGCSC